MLQHADEIKVRNRTLDNIKIVTFSASMNKAILTNTLVILK